MTRKIQVHQVDAFTRTHFTGNPAGVVLNADTLDDAEMLAIARELNNADTAFILSPDGQQIAFVEPLDAGDAVAQRWARARSVEHPRLLHSPAASQSLREVPPSRRFSRRRCVGQLQSAP